MQCLKRYTLTLYIFCLVSNSSVKQNKLQFFSQPNVKKKLTQLEKSFLVN